MNDFPHQLAVSIRYEIGERTNEGHLKPGKIKKQSFYLNGNNKEEIENKLNKLMELIRLYEQENA